MLRNLLEEAGIRAKVLNEHAQGGMGEIPFTHTWPEVWIEREQDVARARAIVRQFDTRPDIEDFVACPRCGEQNPDNFETCWHCGTILK